MVRRFRKCLRHLSESIPFDIYDWSLLTMNWKPREPTGRSTKTPQGPLEVSHARPGMFSFVVFLWGLFAPRVVMAMLRAPFGGHSD